MCRAIVFSIHTLQVPDHAFWSDICVTLVA